MDRWLVATVALVGIAVAASAAVRPPAVAGSFYPGDSARLRAEVETMLDDARAAPSKSPARAVVVPHAGYAFSGPTAALAFARLPAAGVRRVIVLGPSHHMSFAGAALPSEGLSAFATPLGEMALDTEAIARLRGRPGFGGPARAQGPEHALEVELPFLQVVAPDATLVPIVVGGSTDLAGCREIAEAVSELLDDGTVVVASSDFTHYGERYGWAPYSGPNLSDTLLEVGRATAQRVAAGDPRGLVTQVEVTGDTVCGVRPLAVLAALVEAAFDGRGEVLDVTTSGRITGDDDLSVTYAAIAFSGRWTAWRRPPRTTGDIGAAAGAALVDLARATLRGRLAHDAGVATWFAEHGNASWLEVPAGAFVTVNHAGIEAGEPGRLRACMGVIEATQPVVDAVTRAAVWATRDPRFPPLELDELDGLEVEVSVLSPTHQVPSYRDIEVGRHGVFLTKDGRRAVFLPQVATEQGWNRSTMLEHLSLKAGLPSDAWRHGATFEVFTAKVFGEHR
ncbi:MAG: AmmeMemoRadiSam system protein B [Holophagae bacterium]|jgi:AmmeMemoRadiSam system protein B/AmmeMemoRadiSam system protein A